MNMHVVRRRECGFAVSDDSPDEYRPLVVGLRQVVR
jgi:hypothetical protein